MLYTDECFLMSNDFVLSVTQRSKGKWEKTGKRWSADKKDEKDGSRAMN